MHVHSPLHMHGSMHHHDPVRSTNLTRGRTGRSAFDWWPPVDWWPDAARDLLPPGSGTASATLFLPPHHESVHSARNFAARTLAGWGLTGLIDNMALVVSELTTNALRHGLAADGPGPVRYQRHPIRMSLIHREPFVACAISDPGSAAPVLRPSEPYEPGGLGLHIVDTISLRWGWCPLTPRGKAVWAVLKG